MKFQHRPHEGRDRNHHTVEDLEIAINVVWMTMATLLAFLAQIGLTFREAGSVRLKNIQTVLFKSAMLMCLNTIVWWIVGNGIAFGRSYKKFLGISDFMLSADASQHSNDYLSFLFALTQSGVYIAIASGCVAERMPIPGYIFFSTVSIAWTYPIVVHWVWGNGFLGHMDFRDFSGAAVVHLAGGLSGLVATCFIGTRHNWKKTTTNFRPNNITYCVLGSQLLWFSWYGLNCGQSNNAVVEGQMVVPLVAINTTLSASSAGITSIIIESVLSQLQPQSDRHQILSKRYSTISLCNGFISGLVVTTGGCDKYDPWVAFLLGIVAGLAYQALKRLLVILNVDDPQDAISIHGGCGMLGTIAVGVCSYDRGVAYGADWYYFRVQILGAFLISVWVLIWQLMTMFLLRFCKIHLVTENVQLSGLDEDCGGYAYTDDHTIIKVYEILQAAEKNGVIKRTGDNQWGFGEAIVRQSQVNRPMFRGLPRTFNLLNNA